MLDMLNNIIILAILSYFIFLAVKWSLKDQGRDKLLFLGFIILLFTIIYSVSILKYEIGGIVNIKKAVRENIAG